MSGTITQRGKSWRYRADFGRDETGQRLRRTLTIPPGQDGKALGKRAAIAIGEEWASKVRSGTLGNRPGVTLGELLSALMAARPGMSPGTRHDWLWQIEARIPQRLRATAISQIDGHTLDRLYLELGRSGGKVGGPLAPSSVRKVHTILSAAFGQAVKWGWIERSPAERSTPPPLEQQEVVAPPAEAVVALLAHVEDQDPLGDFVHLLVATGARPGEICALKVGDVDLDAGVLVIRRSYSRGDGGTVKGTKTRRVRTMRLDAATCARLRARRQRLAPKALTIGMPLEEFWWFPSPHDPLRPWRVDSMGRTFLQARRASGGPPELTMYGVRHFVASVLVADGVDVRTAAGRLGHGTKRLLDTYAHVLAERDGAAANVVSLHLQRSERVTPPALESSAPEIPGAANP